MKLFTKEQITNALKDSFISNLQEKDYLNLYIDSFDENIPEICVKIAENLAKKVKDFKFLEDDDPGMHPFLNCDSELLDDIGFDYITVCPYKGQVHCQWLDSNYMVTCLGDKLSLIIDIYNVYDLFMTEDEVYNSILQEICNVYRDISWIIEEIYDKKIEEMKELCQTTMSDN